MPDLPDYYTQTLIAEAEAARIKGGLDNNKPDDPVVKDIYLATDTHILYVCFLNGEWTGFDAAILTQGILTLYANMVAGGYRITGLADPTAAQDAATGAYVLARCGLYLPLAGGTMTGAIAMGNNLITGLPAPTLDHHAARKKYVDDLVALYLLLTGGTLTGDLTMGAGQKITIPIDGLMEFVAHTINCNVFGGAYDNVPGELMCQPASGNHMGGINVAPSGTNTSSSYTMFNNSDLENFGILELLVGATYGYLHAGKFGTGTAPTKTYFDMHLVPWTLDTYDLGESGAMWRAIKALHHQFRWTLITDHTWSGLTVELTAGTALVLPQAVYVGGDSKMELADADAAASMPIIALATESIDEGKSGEFLMQGFFRDDTWDWTPGGLLYASLTPGALTQDVSGYATGDQVQVVGVAITADIIHFNPSYELVEIS